MDYLTILQANVPEKAEETPPGLFLAFSGLLAISGILGRQLHHSSLHHPRILSSLCLCSGGFLLMRTKVILDWVLLYSRMTTS